MAKTISQLIASWLCTATFLHPTALRIASLVPGEHDTELCKRGKNLTHRSQRGRLGNTDAVAATIDAYLAKVIDGVKFVDGEELNQPNRVAA